MVEVTPDLEAEKKASSGERPAAKARPEAARAAEEEEEGPATLEPEAEKQAVAIADEAATPAAKQKEMVTAKRRDLKKKPRPPPNVPVNFKTRLCVRFYDSDAGCPFGDRCHFAHGATELRNVQDNIRGRGGAGGGGRASGRAAPFAPGAGTVPFVGGRNPPAEQYAAPENPVLSQVRAAVTSNMKGPWVTAGGSNVYGDNVADLRA